MTWTTQKKAIAIGSAALALTAGGALAGTGSAAAPNGGGGPAAGVPHGWPAGSSLSAQQVVHDARAAARDDGGFVMTFTEVVRRFEVVDVGAAGDSSGDSILFESALFAPGGDRVGRDSVQCTFRIRTFSCDATFQLTGRGKITVSGAFFSGEPQLAVTGGTREFRGVEGQFLPLEGEGEDTRLVFQLTD